jgi:bifunctional non-homologous end joining protein LigD
MPRATLSAYHRKRDFSVTDEPKGRAGRARKRALEFVIQKHGARRLHYDFRLELDGVMKSWAVTRGPSYDPEDKRLAVRTEDHPMEYNRFEGVIPAKQYGAGPVMIWDQGTWSPDEDPRKGLEKGHLAFHIDGTRMHGKWHLVRMHTEEKRENWLLIKSDDEYALQGKRNLGFLDAENTSAVSGRTLDQIRGAVARQMPAKRTGPKSRGMTALQEQYGNVELATLVEYPPAGDDWLHEIKYDGYRMLAFISNGSVLLQTRGKQDWTLKFPGLVAELARLPVTEAVLDGEVGVLDERGRTNFSALQDALSAANDGDIEGWFFDLLHLDGKDYSARPLVERKAALREILPQKSRRLHFSEHVDSGPHLLEEACKVGAEGLVSKLKSSSYRGRRTRDWVKSKCALEQEFVIGGFMPAKQHARAVGALLLGYYRNGKLHYAGKVGTGFSQNSAREIYQRLIKLKTAQAPFPGKIERGLRDYVWVAPQQLCQVSFWEWTADKRIRHAAFKGLREDKAPKDVHEDKPQVPPRGSKSKGAFTIEGIVITHPEREVFPGTGITKGDVAIYYATVMEYLLPFAENRLLSLMRCTETIAGECFFQRAPMPGGKGKVMELTSTHKGHKHTYLYTDSPAGIIELVQMNAIEFHAWQSRVDAIDKPNQLVFDLDPSEEVPFAAVKLAAQDVRKRLQKCGLQSFPSLTGGKGVHVVAPIAPQYEWGAIKAFAQGFAQSMQHDAPEAYTANMSKQKRKGRIFIDYLRNEYSATAIVPFSLRARAGAPIAVPLSWRELEKTESAHPYAYANHKKILNVKMRRAMEVFFATRQELTI